MQYMLLIYSAEDSWSEQEMKACLCDSLDICNELDAQGKLVSAAPLHSIATATSVRLRQGKRMIMDGPFAETTEQLGGYYIIDVTDLDEAIRIASRLPPAKKGTIEIRPILDLAGVSSDAKS